MHYTLSLIIAFWTLPPSLAIGEPFTMFGMSNMSCGAYLQEVSNNEVKATSYARWVSGFVSGTNLMKERVTSTDPEGLNGWLKQYCAEHPLDTFAKAAIELNRELDKSQYRP